MNSIPDIAEKAVVNSFPIESVVMHATLQDTWDAMSSSMVEVTKSLAEDTVWDWVRNDVMAPTWNSTGDAREEAMDG